MSVGGRLAKVEAELERQRLMKSPVLRGALEVNCTGGLGRIEGIECKEHEACVFHSTPIMGSIRRQYLFDWYEGMRPLSEMIG